MNTSVLEGINNKIKFIKRMAYGYRDNDYFFYEDQVRLSRKAAMNHKKSFETISPATFCGSSEVGIRGGENDSLAVISRWPLVREP